MCSTWGGWCWGPSKWSYCEARALSTHECPRHLLCSTRRTLRPLLTRPASDARPQAGLPPPPLQVAVESTGDESGDAAQVEKQLLSLRKSKAKLKASNGSAAASWPACGSKARRPRIGAGQQQGNPASAGHPRASAGHPSAASSSLCRTGCPTALM